MMEEQLHFKQQRQEAFNWLYNLVSPRYEEMVEQHFDAKSDMIPVFKALIAYRIAMETALLFKDTSEYHVNTYSDIKNQLSSQVSSVIRGTQNPWLKKCFGEGQRFQPGSVEFHLRQDLITEIAKSFDFLREQVLSPEMEQLRESSKAAWSFQPWMLVAGVAGLMMFGVFFNFGTAALLFNKDVFLGVGSALLLAVCARWTVNYVPSLIRSWQLYIHYGQWLGDKEKRHIENLHPDNLIGDKSYWFSFLNISNKSGVNEVWVDLNQWMSLNLNLYTLNEPTQEVKLQTTPGRPASWGPISFFRNGQVVNVVQEKSRSDQLQSAETSSVVSPNQLGRYAPGS